MKLVTASVLGTAGEVPTAYFKIWHGLVPALYMSIIAVVGGLLLMTIYRPLQRLWDATPRPEAKTIFDALIEGIVAPAKGLIHPLHNGAFSRYAGIFAVAVLGAGYHAWATGMVGPQTRSLQPITVIEGVGWLLLVAATCGLVWRSKTRP